MSFSKDELMALHGLLYETKEYLNEEDDMDWDRSYRNYEKLDILPHYAHRSKSEHEEAVQILTTTIINSISEENYSEPGFMLEEKH